MCVPQELKISTQEKSDGKHNRFSEIHEDKNWKINNE